MPSDFEIHPDIATIFRPWTADQEAVNRVSFLNKGILVPLKVWCDGNAKWWIIEGINRFRLWKKIKKEGLAIELPTEQFVGTEREALAHAGVLNKDRRNLSSSELAASAVVYHRLDRKYEMREQGLKLAPPEGEPVGLAAKLAEGG